MFSWGNLSVFLQLLQLKEQLSFVSLFVLMLFLRYHFLTSRHNRVVISSIILNIRHLDFVISSTWYRDEWETHVTHASLSCCFLIYWYFHSHCVQLVGKSYAADAEKQSMESHLFHGQNPCHREMQQQSPFPSSSRIPFMKQRRSQWESPLFHVVLQFVITFILIESVGKRRMILKEYTVTIT